MLFGETVAVYCREREKSEFRIIGGGSERHYQDVGGSEITKMRLEGSQALPASPSGRVGYDLTLALEII
jgi:hypothetical protein